MPPVDSRLGPGTLTFGVTPDDFSAQVSKCSIVPNVNEEDGTPTLSTPDPSPEMTVDWSLDGELISDWGDATGFVLWALDNSGTEKAFQFIPDTDNGMTFTGTVQVRPIEIGGDVAVQSVVGFSFPLTGAPDYTPGA